MKSDLHLPARPRSASRSGGTLDLSRAVGAILPDRLDPQLATLAAAVPSGPDWIIEVKFDGYRMLVRIQQGQVRLFTRGGHDWTSKLKLLAADIAQLGISEAWLDGEAVVLKDGLPDFNALQNAIRQAPGTITFFVFDLPYWDGKDLRQVPLRARQALLAHLISGASDRIRLSERFEDAPPAEVFRAACDLGLEGLMAKRADAAYVSARTTTWLKIKCMHRQEFVVCGYTIRSDSPQEVGKLLLGYHEQGKLRYAGSVGTGWTARTGQDLKIRLSAIETARPPFEILPAKKFRADTVHWVQPLLVAEVVFAEWTPGGHIRHSSFKGLRTDKPASQIVREGVNLKS